MDLICIHIHYDVNTSLVNPGLYLGLHYLTVLVKDFSCIIFVPQEYLSLFVIDLDMMDPYICI